MECLHIIKRKLIHSQWCTLEKGEDRGGGREREGEGEGQGEIEREREGEGEKGRERDRERGREGEGEGERERVTSRLPMISPAGSRSRTSSWRTRAWR